MHLNLKTKVVRFELLDDDSETTVVLQQEDDQETMVRKLRKVLALASGPEEPDLLSTVKAVADRTAEVRERVRAVTGGQADLGWKKYAKPEVPEHLKGEVEMIEGGQQ